MQQNATATTLIIIVLEYLLQEPKLLLSYVVLIKYCEPETAYRGCKHSGLLLYLMGSVKGECQRGHLKALQELSSHIPQTLRFYYSVIFHLLET